MEEIGYRSIEGIGIQVDARHTHTYRGMTAYKDTTPVIYTQLYTGEDGHNQMT
jgi:hypothetical protein